MSEQSEFTHLQSLVPFEPVAGVWMRPVSGERAMLNYIELEPNAVVPVHSHPHEQLGYVISGEITMSAEGAEHRCGPGFGYRIAGDVEHGGVAGPDGCVVIDVFSPVREDYREASERVQAPGSGG
jgi:quercetin dioxygenase-like cupin family protein